MNYHVAKEHATSTSKHSTFCSSCEQEFPSYTLSNIIGEKNIERNNENQEILYLNKIVEEEGESEEKLKEELSACQHFPVDTEKKNGTHEVFKFQMSKLVIKITNEKLDDVFNTLDSAKNQYCSWICSSYSS